MNFKDCVISSLNIDTFGSNKEVLAAYILEFCTCKKSIEFVHRCKMHRNTLIEKQREAMVYEF